MQVNNIYRQVQPHKCCLLPNTHKTKSFVSIINLHNIQEMLWLAYGRVGKLGAHMSLSPHQVWDLECPGQGQAGDSYVGWQLVCLPNSGARLLKILLLGLGQPGAGPGRGTKATPGGQKGCWVVGSCEGVICVGWVPPQLASLPWGRAGRVFCNSLDVFKT